jgi:hypothetical protein
MLSKLLLLKEINEIKLKSPYVLKASVVTVNVASPMYEISLVGQ